MTLPEIFEVLKRFKWSSFHWWQFHNLFALFGGSLAEVSRRWMKRRNARLAQNWPSVDGRVQRTNVVKGTRFYGAARHPTASFTYSYSMNEGSETDYYTGDFSRPFPEEDRAWEWLWTLKDRKIRVHVNPDKPEVSAVLAAIWTRTSPSPSAPPKI